ncbi:MAG: histone [Candidatus Bathyarchaeia archaeon]|jgi:histone H3/H4|nr:MAG: histone [Candidatus Bathyarchaeota archaeon]
MAEEFTIAPIRRLLKKAGNLRINEGAANKLRDYIGEYGELVAERAVELAMKDGRKTVLERDIREAALEIWVPEENEDE